MTSDIDVVESWVKEFSGASCIEKWTTGDSHRLVYDIGGPQHLEVHSAFLIELNGRPMQVPACVVLSGDTDFEFFADKAELFVLLGSKKKGHKKAAAVNIATIEKWVETFKEQHPTITCDLICGEIENENLNYGVTDSSGTSRVMDIIAATHSTTPHSHQATKARAGFADTGNYKTFTDEHGLNVILDKMLTHKPLNTGDIDSIEQHVVKFKKQNRNVICKVTSRHAHILECNVKDARNIQGVMHIATARHQHPATVKLSEPPTEHPFTDETSLFTVLKALLTPPLPRRLIATEPP